MQIKITKSPIGDFKVDRVHDVHNGIYGEYVCSLYGTEEYLHWLPKIGIEFVYLENNSEAKS